MSEYRENFTSFFHWFAWAISGLASLFFFFFEIAQDVADMVSGKAPYLLIFVPALILAISGCIVSFFKKIIGGSLMIAGAVIMLATLYFHDAQPDFRMMIIYGFPYIFPGIVFIFVRK